MMSTTERRPTTMLECALDALEHGLAVVPPAEDGTKRPDGRWKTFQQQLPTSDDVHGWYAAGERTGIGLVTGAVSGNLEMLEFEGRAMEENIGDAFADLAAAAGLTTLVDRINAGYCETTPTGGLHLLYRVSDGPVAGNTKLARRPATAAELASNPDDKVRVLIETRGEGGYVVVAPSHGTVHATGNEWVLLNGGFGSIATITVEERDALHEVARALDRMPTPAAPAPASPAPSVGPFGDDLRPGDAYNQAADAALQTLQLLERHGWTRVFDRPHDGHTDVHLRRPGKNLGTSAVLHMDAGTLVVFSTSTPFDAEHGYTPFAVLTVLEHGGDHSAAARQLRPASAGQRDDLAWARISNGTTAPPAGSAGGAGAAWATHLPDSFWTARPALDHIRQAARSRLVSPDAVLGAVLTRVAAITPHAVEIPAIVGSPLGLTYYAGIVGSSEAGKSAAANVAGELLPAPSHVLDRLPIGSGEGMVEILFDLVDEEGENGRKRKVKRQTRHAAIFHIDEGQILSDLANRQGTTLMPTLRTAYTHGTLGNANASTERKRIVDGRTYVYGITLGIQPELAGPLLADTAGGTPQRFVWLNATDPHASAGHAWPGELTWTPPDHRNLEAYAIQRGTYLRYQLDVDDAIKAQIVDDRIAVQRGEHRDPGDSHRMLVRLKTAALLALLDRRLTISTLDWDLANVIVTTSRALRLQVEGTLHVLDQQREQAGVDRLARREVAVAQAQADSELSAASRSAANIVHRHHEASPQGHADSCARRCIHGALSSRMRREVGTDDAIAEAVRRGWIKRDGDRFTPGDARPA